MQYPEAVDESFLLLLPNTTAVTQHGGSSGNDDTVQVQGGCGRDGPGNTMLHPMHVFQRPWSRDPRDIVRERKFETMSFWDDNQAHRSVLNRPPAVKFTSPTGLNVHVVELNGSLFASDSKCAFQAMENVTHMCLLRRESEWYQRSIIIDRA